MNRIFNTAALSRRARRFQVSRAFFSPIRLHRHAKGPHTRGAVSAHALTEGFRFPRQLLPALVFLQRLLVFVLSGIPLHVAPQAGISRVHPGKPCTHSAAQCTGRTAGQARFQCCKERILVEQRLGRFLVAHHSVNGFVGVGLHKGLHSIVRTAGNGVGNGRVGFPERLIAHLSAHPVRNGTGHRVLGVIRAHSLGKVGHTHAVDGPSCAKLCRCFQNSFFRALPRFVTGSHAVACAVGTQHRQHQRWVDGTHDQVLSRAGSSPVEEPPHIALACHSVRSQVFSGLVGIPAPLIQPFHAVAVVIRLVVELTTPDSFVGCPDELRVISCRFQLLVGVTPALNTPDHLLFGTGRQGRGQCARVLPDCAFDIFLFSLQIALHTPSGPFAKAQVIVRLHVKPGPVDFVLGVAHLFQIAVHVPGVFQHRHYTHAARVRCQVVHARRKVCCAYSPAWQRGICHQPRQLPVPLGSILPVVHRAVNVHSDTVVPLFPQLLHGAGILLHLLRRAHCHLLPVQLVAPAVHGIRKAQVVPCPVILQRRGIQVGARLLLLGLQCRTFFGHFFRRPCIAFIVRHRVSRTAKGPTIRGAVSALALTEGFCPASSGIGFFLKFGPLLGHLFCCPCHFCSPYHPIAFQTLAATSSFIPMLTSRA